MTKLKTLKDLEFVSPLIEEKLEYVEGLEKWIKGDRFVSSLILKQEAIKWIKEINEESVYGSQFNGLEENEDEIVKNFIKHFFNLTEEELKNEKRK